MHVRHCACVVRQWGGQGGRRGFESQQSGAGKPIHIVDRMCACRPVRAQGGTALSSGEVGQGYREVADPSVFVKFPLVDEPNTSLVVWTTTPWTLPSNTYTAVHRDFDYAICHDAETDERLIVAESLVTTEI